MQKQKWINTEDLYPLISIFRNLSLILTLLVVMSCATTEKVNLEKNDIRYSETKALIEDKTKSSSNTVSIDVFDHVSGAIRLEISALLGYSVGSLLMTRSQISYAVHPKKFFVSGPFATKTLKPLFKQEIDPKVIWSAIFDLDIQKYGFSCDSDLSEKLAQRLCIKGEALDRVSVLFENVQNSQDETESKPKKITIESAAFKFVWIFKSIKKHNRSYNETFVLNPPQNYRLITIK